MKQIINIDLLKENPELFFSQLPEKAEKEINDFLRFVFFKYEITNLDTNKELEKKSFNLFIENPIIVEKLKKYTREDLHER